jgi:hypothetical protein
MQRKIWRLCAAACTIIAVFAVPAVSAQAATTTIATTYKAIAVGAESAYLTGAVAPSGQAAVYQFQYGTTTSYGKSTPVADIAAGQSGVFVYKLVTGLKPNTTYHFRLAAAGSELGPYGYGYGYYSGNGVGADATFKTTGAGRPVFSSLTFGVKNGKASFRLKCDSTIACKGKYSSSIKTKVKGKSKTYACVSGSYSISAGQTGKFSPKIGKSCLALVNKAKHHKLTGVSLTLTSSTYQPTLHRKITLG